ncbi:Ribosomal oxygenase 2-like protein [Drosera capensis]
MDTCHVLFVVTMECNTFAMNKACPSPTTESPMNNHRRWRRPFTASKQPRWDPQHPTTILSITLAAAARSSPSPSTLTSLHRLLLHSPSSLTSSHLSLALSVLPSLLSAPSTTIIGLRIVGAAALSSFEANERIVREDGIVRAVVRRIRSEGRGEVMAAACDAVLDLAVSVEGRRRLVEANGLAYMMVGFIQVYKTLKPSISVSSLEKGDAAYLGVENSKDKLLMLLLSAAVTLINSCNVEQLEELPKKLVETLVIHFKQLWAQVRMQILAGKVTNMCQGRQICLRNLTASNFAESLFRLSINARARACEVSTEVMVRQIFGSSDWSFMDFLSNHWESSTFLLRKPTKSLDEDGDVFSSFKKLLNSSGTFSYSLSSVLQGLVSCPPIASDETSILNFLKDKRDVLGCPLIYEQDIRVLRTDIKSKAEQHYFERSLEKDSPSPNPHAFIHMKDIIECEDAYKLGYTIALRGMEFRCMEIAAISDKLATLFGQPSAGANLYLTPPNSQGLACHYDDHCVFICQLLGTKQWTVSPNPVVQLPCLYQHLQNPSGSTVEGRHIVLREGDILYLPRGIAHEASTSTGGNGLYGAADFSLHLTLSVEIEPPFEWEGFAHIALHCWSQNNSNTPQNLAAGLCSRMDVILISFLHVAIELGNSDFVFRKACLVAADHLDTDTKEWLNQNQRATFNQLTHKIYEMSNFTKVLENIRMTLQRSEDPFYRIRWLSVLTHKKLNEHDWDLPLEGINELLPLIDQHKDEFEAAFMSIKSKFCREVVFEDVERSFKTIHAMYKKTRQQYVNGMLSLHS